MTVLDRLRQSARGGKKPIPSLVGTRIGNYVVVRLLGQGGMGEVYLVEHPDIGTQAAVKVLGERFSTMKHATERFRAEARAIARIKHPNVVEIHDYGSLEDGRLYYQMEHLEGRVLEAVMASKRRMSAEEVLPYLDQICAGLSAAHENHIVHRDLKPENIIVIDGPPMKLKILDFGIAKLLETFSGGANTSVGVLLGTPVVMAPEQAAGQPERISFRTDLYSLGVILYWMLTGHPPFLDDAPGMLVSRHINDTPQPLLQLVPSIPQGVAELVERCLAKAPEDRPSSALELAAEFSEALLWQPVVPVSRQSVSEDKTSVFDIRPAPAQALDEDREASARTAVIQRPDRGEALALAQIPTLDDEDVQTLQVGPRRVLTLVLLIAAVAVVAGVVAGVLLSMAHENVAAADAGVVALARPADRAAAVEPDSQPAAAPLAGPLTEDSGAAVPDRAPPTATSHPDAAPPAAASDLAAPDRAALPDPPAADLAPPKKIRHRRRQRPRRRVVRHKKPRQKPGQQAPRVPKKLSARSPKTRPRPRAPVDNRPAILQVATNHNKQFITANIFLDGTFIGQSPLLLRNVSTGIHLVEARQKGYKRVSRHVRLLPGKSTSLSFVLQRK